MPKLRRPHLQFWAALRAAAWIPALVLILVQVTGGLRDMPQFAFLLIYLQERFGLPPMTISSIISGSQLIGMLTALVGGAAAARLGSKYVLLAGLSLLGLSSLAFFAPFPWLAAAFWLLSGAGTALTAVGGASCLTQISARGGLGALAAFYALSATAGGAIGSPLAGLLIERAGYQAFAAAAMLLSASIILTVMLLMPRFETQTTGQVSVKSIGSGLSTTARQPNMLLLAGMRALPTIFYGMLTVLIPLMLNNLTGSKITVAIYGTANLLVASLAQLLAGRAADRWGARLPTTIAYLGLASAGVGLAFTHDTVWGLFGFGVLGIAAAWSLSTMMYVWVNDGVPKSGHPATFGLLHAIWSISMISGTVLGGWLVESVPALPFFIGASLNCAAIFLGAVYFSRLRQNQTSQVKNV